MRSAAGFEEALALPEPAEVAVPPLADRLQAYARLLTLAADELAALEQGNLARRREISEEREELTLELLSPPPADEALTEDPEELDSASLPDRIAMLLAEVLDALESRDEEERRMQDRWSSLEGDALRAIHVGGRIVSLRAGRYPNEPQLDTSLDVRF